MPKTLINERYMYQRYIIDYLVGNNDFIERDPALKYFDPVMAIDGEMMLAFIKDTQQEEYEKLYDFYGTNTDDVILNGYNKFITSKNGSTLSALKKGFYVDQSKFDLFYPKPTTTDNPENLKYFKANRFTVMQEVRYDEKVTAKRIDLVIFLNGVPLFAIELKCNPSGQNTNDAIKQLMGRNHKTRLFTWKKGALVHFAMDLKTVAMSTRLSKSPKCFLPFNKGDDETGIGNAGTDDKFPVAYMWEEMFTKEMILQLVDKYIFLEQKLEQDEKTGKVTTKETIIFPRYHQLRAVKTLLADMSLFGTKKNYLIQHSAGSGKTNSIAWLAHQLANLKVDNKLVVNTVFIITDRIVVDRQLQKAIQQIDHQEAYVEVMGKDERSEDLVKAINKGTNIIVSTIHKFSYILDAVNAVGDKTFAVIIDEAHSSTGGSLINNVKAALNKNRDGDEDGEIDDMDDIIALANEKMDEDIASRKKQSNISMIAFTATPKPKTLRKFGVRDVAGDYHPFDIYSMKQAIDEGFILNVLQNYYTYQTFTKIIEKTDNDELFETSQAKREINKLKQLHDTTIAQKVKIIIEHYKEHVMHLLNGKAKAMIVTSSRQQAYKYYNAFNQYIVEKGYSGIKPLVAFSGELNFDGTTVSEVSVNGFTESELPDQFNSDAYQVLLVADKYQTGFDQPKLVAMYVDKTLRGVTAVQTLSRLNRIYSGKTKTFVLDFANGYEDMEKSFSKYYTDTLLNKDVNPHDIYEIKSRIELYSILNATDMADFSLVYYTDSKIEGKMKLEYYLDRAYKRFLGINDDAQREIIVKDLRGFIKFYDFLTQVTAFKDNTMHEMYLFLYYLVKEIKIGGLERIDLSDKIDLEFGGIKLKKAHEKLELDTEAGEFGLPGANLPTFNKQFKKLSEILAEYNAIHGTDFEPTVVNKVVEQTLETLAADDDIRTKAKHNGFKNFRTFLNGKIDDAIMDAMDSSQKFNNEALENEELKNDVFGLFIENLYFKMREE